RISTPEPDSSTGLFLPVPLAGLMASTATTVGDTLRATLSKRSLSRPTSAAAVVGCGCGLVWATAGGTPRFATWTATAPPRNAQEPRKNVVRIWRMIVDPRVEKRRTLPGRAAGCEPLSVYRCGPVA